MSDNCNTPHPLKRQGCSQLERLPESLLSDYVKIDERSIVDLMKQTAEYSNFIKFQDSAINWNEFFISFKQLSKTKSVEEIIEELENGETSPHLSLVLCFLRIFQASVQKEINYLTEKHLRLFYEEILHLEYKEEIPDEAILFGELEKNQKDVLIPKGSKFLAGKDALGNIISYKSKEDTVLNKAQIGSINTMYVSKNNLQISSILSKSNANIIESINGQTPVFSMFGSTEDLASKIGFAISSPIFFLKEGLRIITLVINNLTNISASNFSISYTSDEKWVDIPTDKFKIENSSIIINLDQSQPSFTQHNSEVHGALNTKLPTIKITISNYENYEHLVSLKCDIRINVEVQNCKNLILSNELGDIDPSKPFYPFGSRPMANESYLLMGYNQAFNKYLDSFKIVPISKPHLAYDEYFVDNFQILNNGTWTPITIGLSTIDNPNLVGYLDPPNSEYTINSNNGFLKIIMNNENHDYNKQLKKYTDEVAKLASTEIKNINIGLPNIPELSSLTLNYNASLNCIEDQDTTIFQILPFGFKTINLVTQSINNIENLFPLFPNEGNLYLGIDQLQSGQLLSVYFQLLDGSNTLDIIPPKVSWAYLANNTWMPFDFQHIIKDTTYGFQSSGIITFDIPNAAFISNNTILNSDKVWISAFCDSLSGGIPKAIKIKTQAFEVIFDDDNNEKSHLKNGLPAGTISKIEDTIDGLKKIEQILPTYGGKEKETYLPFVTRTSELLRHKNRAVNIWDYERMVLGNFPETFKVKCISHTSNLSEYAPGNIILVVLPKFISKEIQNSLYPKLSLSVRGQIKLFLGNFHSPFINLEIINPLFEALQVITNITVNEGLDKSFYSQQLNKDLINFFAPWLNSSEEKLQFNGELYKSDIINFIDERPYIHHIDFLEIRKFDANNVHSIICDEHIISANQSSIFTSVANHIINPNMPC